jgi:GcvH upstream region-like protein
MLHFFRKYERYIFVVITVVIVISFSFFGTYNTLQSPEKMEKIAFTAVDGSKISRSEVEELLRFIRTDNEDKLLWGGAWGPNFLNDGVIKKEFLETGFAQILAAQYSNEIRKDWEKKHSREKNYSPYIHPQANFISAANAWKILYPDLEIQFSYLQTVLDPMSSQGIDARVKLYLAERKLPAPMLRQVLRYQEKQYTWVPRDSNLSQIDLSLFGYHSIEDWLGLRFTHLVAEYILNSAIIAEKSGYRVSKEEALADLFRNAELSFQQNSQNPNLGVATISQYFDEQLRRLGMDQNMAVNLWQKVMLFRRLFHNDDNVVLKDRSTYIPLQVFSLETLNGDLYQLPLDLRLSDFVSLQLFETYLDVVSLESPNNKLNLPINFHTLEEVMKSNPELVQRRYLLDMAKVDKKSLQIKAGIKDTWNWEISVNNWEKLKQQFPELGVKKSATVEERQAALDSLDKKTRAKLDSFARASIVEEHPEWLKAALNEAKPQRQLVSLKKKGESATFPGLKESETLIALLDNYPATAEKLSQYTPDQDSYFSIKVVDLSPEWEIQTFAEAIQEDVLNKILQNNLEKQYEQIRQKHPKRFQNNDGEWKPYALVKMQVADLYFSSLLETIKKDYIQSTSPANSDMPMINDFAASLRLYSHMRDLRDRFTKNPDAILGLVRSKDSPKENKLPVREPLQNQWKIDHSVYNLKRNASEVLIDKEKAFVLNVNDWSPLFAKPTGDISFFCLKEKQEERDPLALYEMVMTSHRYLSREAQKTFMLQQLNEMEEKKGLSLSYFNIEQESS